MCQCFIYDVDLPNINVNYLKIYSMHVLNLIYWIDIHFLTIYSTEKHFRVFRNYLCKCYIGEKWCHAYVACVYQCHVTLALCTIVKCLQWMHYLEVQNIIYISRIVMRMQHWITDMQCREVIHGYAWVFNLKMWFLITCLLYTFGKKDYVISLLFRYLTLQDWDYATLVTYLSV